MQAAGPWTGATVKLDITLKAPVLVGAVLLIEATVVSKTTSKSGKVKYMIHAELRGPPGTSSGGVASAADGATDSSADNGKVYATMEGISLNGVTLSADPTAKPDAVDKRVWIQPTSAAASSGGSVLRDTGWNSP